MVIFVMYGAYSFMVVVTFMEDGAAQGHRLFETSQRCREI